MNRTEVFETHRNTFVQYSDLEERVLCKYLSAAWRVGFKFPKHLSKMLCETNPTTLCNYDNIFVPGTQMTPVLNGKDLVLEG